MWLNTCKLIFSCTLEDKKNYIFKSLHNSLKGQVASVSGCSKLLWVKNIHFHLKITSKAASPYSFLLLRKLDPCIESSLAVLLVFFWSTAAWWYVHLQPNPECRVNLSTHSLLLLADANNYNLYESLVCVNNPFKVRTAGKSNQGLITN